MLNLLKRLFNRPQPSDETLALQAEIQRMHLNLEEAQSRIARLEAELSRQQRSSEASRENTLQAQMLEIFGDLASPAAQFLLQLDLIETSGQSLQARDILAVARSLLRILQNHGLEISEPVGIITSFDPALHEPLSATKTLQPGQPVSVRLPGLSFQGQRLRKAGVIPQEE